MVFFWTEKIGVCMSYIYVLENRICIVGSEGLLEMAKLILYKKN